MSQTVTRSLEEIVQQSSRTVFASLVRSLGDFDLAEDAMQDAFASAMTQWPLDGVPVNPVSVALKFICLGYAEMSKFGQMSESDSMQHVVELRSKHPGVRMGPFELRPADESINELIQARDKRLNWT